MLSRRRFTLAFKRRANLDCRTSRLPETTTLPCGVGHCVSDVIGQLAPRTDIGRSVLSCGPVDGMRPRGITGRLGCGTPIGVVHGDGEATSKPSSSSTRTIDFAVERRPRRIRLPNNDSTRGQSSEGLISGLRREGSSTIRCGSGASCRREAVPVHDRVPRSRRRADACRARPVGRGDRVQPRVRPRPPRAAALPYPPCSRPWRWRPSDSGSCPLVFNNDLRHPAVLAQELASLDILSGGRTEVGIGAGWHEPEYRGARTPVRPGRFRIDRMTEAVAVLRGLFARRPVQLLGRVLHDHRGWTACPKPVQRPHPPFLIGGTRERVVRLAAREADIVGLDLRQDGAMILDAFQRRGPTSGSVGSGTRPATALRGQLDLSVLRPGRRHHDHRHASSRWPPRWPASSATRTGVADRPRDVLESPYSLIGTVPDLVDKLVRTRQRWGINSYMVGWFDEPGLRRHRARSWSSWPVRRSGRRPPFCGMVAYATAARR